MFIWAYRCLADWVGPNSNIPWRWSLKNFFLRKLNIKIGNGVAIDSGFECLYQGGLVVNDFSVIGKNVKIYNFSPIFIGKYCMFGGEIIISNGGHDKNTFEPFSGLIEIGNGCWIGTGAKIVGANISIGNNAIVGAGALVNKDVPAGAIVVGVPARIIGYRNLPSKVWHLGSTWFSPHTFDAVN
jgi:acetyltransferase-like isoleucine patch superfamily enzyme